MVIPQFNDANARMSDSPDVDVGARESIPIDERGVHSHRIVLQNRVLGVHLGLERVLTRHESADMVRGCSIVGPRRQCESHWR